MHSCELVQKKLDQVNPLRVPAEPRLPSPSKFHFINGQPSQESTTTMWATCITTCSFPSSEKNLPTHNMMNCFTISHIISFGSGGDLPKPTSMGSSICLKPSYKPTRTSSSLHQNQDVILSVSLLCWCSGQMLPNSPPLVMRNSGLATCFLAMSRSTGGASPPVACAATLHILIMYVLAFCHLKYPHNF